MPAVRIAVKAGTSFRRVAEAEKESDRTEERKDSRVQEEEE